MKKITIILLFSSLSIIASAQLQKGNLLLSGGFGFSGSSSNSTNLNTSGNKSFNGQINPQIGWFLSDRSVIGLQPGYSFLKSKIVEIAPFGTSKRYTSTISIMPFYRHYFPIGEKVAFFIHGKAGISFRSIKDNFQRMDSTGVFVPASTKIKTTSYAAYISPGVAVFISPKFSIEAMISTLSYEYIRSKPSSSENYNTNNFNFTFNTFTFGATWYFSKRK